MADDGSECDDGGGLVFALSVVMHIALSCGVIALSCLHGVQCVSAHGEQRREQLDVREVREQPHEQPDLREQSEQARQQVARWLSFLVRTRRIAKRRRTWAALGHHLAETKGRSRR